MMTLLVAIKRKVKTMMMISKKGQTVFFLSLLKIFGTVSAREELVQDKNRKEPRPVYLHLSKDASPRYPPLWNGVRHDHHTTVLPSTTFRCRSFPYPYDSSAGFSGGCSQYRSHSFGLPVPKKKGSLNLFFFLWFRPFIFPFLDII